MYLPQFGLLLFSNFSFLFTVSYKFWHKWFVIFVLLALMPYSLICFVTIRRFGLNKLLLLLFVSLVRGFPVCINIFIPHVAKNIPLTISRRFRRGSSPYRPLRPGPSAHIVNILQNVSSNVLKDYTRSDRRVRTHTYTYIYRQFTCTGVQVCMSVCRVINEQGIGGRPRENERDRRHWL